MNAEQKQRMAHELGQWNAAMKSSCSVSDLLAISTRMSALLQELIDAPEPEPVGYTNETELDYVRTYEALPVSGAFWPTSDEDACVALYTAPPANNQSEQHLEMVNPPAPSVPDWLETTRFLTDVTTAAGLLEHGLRDKGLAQRIGDFAYKYRMLAAAPAAPERDQELVRDAERYRYTAQKGYFEIKSSEEWGAYWVIGVKPERGTPEWKKGSVGIWTTGKGKTREAAIDAAIERDKQKGGEA